MNAPEKIIEPAPVDRQKFIGGSDAAAVMGLSPYATPVELWLEKTGQREREQPDPVRQRILDRGKKLEPFVLDMVLDKLRERGHQIELIQRNQRYIDPEHPFLAAEIDFELLLDGEHINGDCKTVIGFARKKWGDEDTDEVPIEYAAQFMHGLMVTNRRRCLVAALIGLDDVAIYWVDRDEETIAGMRAKEVEFWQRCVIGGERPDVFTFSDVKALFPRDNGQAIEATDEIAEKVRELAELKAKHKALEESIDALQLDIAEFISPNAILTHAGKEIATWKGQPQTTFMQKEFRAAHPELAEQFTRRGTVRVLRLKKEK